MAAIVGGDTIAIDFGATAADRNCNYVAGNGGNVTDASLAS